MLSEFRGLGMRLLAMTRALSSWTVPHIAPMYCQRSSVIVLDIFVRL